MTAMETQRAERRRVAIVNGITIVVAAAFTTPLLIVLWKWALS